MEEYFDFYPFFSWQGETLFINNPNSKLSETDQTKAESTPPSH
jgi:hypothetical protein